MSKALTEYISAWYRAESYARDAKTYIEKHLADIESTLNTLYSSVTSKLEAIPLVSLDTSALRSDVYSFLGEVKSSIQRPSNLDDPISVENLPEYRPYDTKFLQSVISKIVNNLEQLPSRLLSGLSLLDDLYKKINTDLTDGGYGIEPSDEQALWNRARDRELKNADTAITMLVDKASAFGYVLPPGVLINSMQESIDKAHSGISELNREITIKRAELFRDNRRFTIETARQLADQLFGITKFKIETLQKVTEADVALAKLTLEEFGHELEAFKIRVEKAISAKRLLTEIWSIDVDAWGKKANAATQAASVLVAASAQALENVKVMSGFALERVKLFEIIWEKQVEILIEKIRQVSGILSGAANAAFGTLSGIFSLIQTEEEE